jgi:hypothetical protein
VIATVVGWIIVGLVAYWLLGAVLGTIRWLIHLLVWLVVLGGLITLYAKLKSPD